MRLKLLSANPNEQLYELNIFLLNYRIDHHGEFPSHVCLTPLTPYLDFLTHNNLARTLGYALTLESHD